MRLLGTERRVHDDGICLRDLCIGERDICLDKGDFNTARRCILSCDGKGRFIPVDGNDFSCPKQCRPTGKNACSSPEVDYPHVFDVAMTVRLMQETGGHHRRGVILFALCVWVGKSRTALQ